MQTNISEGLKGTPEGEEAEAIVRACVHCGFCLATCPTYQLLGDELDSPRGRIYLIKQVLEGEPVSEKTQLHLDRCLTCRACETTCPSGVKYGRLLDIGRGMVDARVKRSPKAALQRQALQEGLSRPTVFKVLLKTAQAVRPLLPARLRGKVPQKRVTTPWPARRHPRTMLVLDGCVQPSLEPNINAAAARLLDRLGISLVKAAGAGCCGALKYHLGAHEAGLSDMRRNIDAWWPHVRGEVEAIVSTASGCGVVIKDYGHLLASDLGYSATASRVGEMTRDIAEVVAAEKDSLLSLLESLPKPGNRLKVAFQAPCTLQHGQKIRGVVESLLTAAGFDLTPVPNGHLCCGSAGTYSILQPELSQQLLKNKVEALQSGKPDVIVTANIGCLTHVQSGAAIPVRHWVELLEQRIAESGPISE
jgi:glycolate oxidase iron-sulfur subunit